MLLLFLVTNSHKGREGMSSDLARKRCTFPRQGGELDTFAQEKYRICLPREGRGKLPRGFHFRKHEPFDQDLQLSFIIPTVIEKSFENEFRALLNLVTHLTEGLGPKGPGLLRIPHRWSSVTWSLLTVRRPLELSTINRGPSVCSTM